MFNAPKGYVQDIPYVNLTSLGCWPPASGKRSYSIGAVHTFLRAMLTSIEVTAKSPAVTWASMECILELCCILMSAALLNSSKIISRSEPAAENFKDCRATISTNHCGVGTSINVSVGISSIMHLHLRWNINLCLASMRQPISCQHRCMVCTITCRSSAPAQAIYGMCLELAAVARRQKQEAAMLARI